MSDKKWCDVHESFHPHFPHIYYGVDKQLAEAEAALSEAQQDNERLRKCVSEMDAQEQENDAQVAQLQTTISQLTEALQNYVDAFGGLHEEECPEDDTCDCKWKPMNDLTNAALVHAQEKP